MALIAKARVFAQVFGSYCFKLRLLTMAFLLRNSVASHFQSHSQRGQNDSLSQSRRQFHVEPGPREKALLAPDPTLKRFKSHKKGVALVKRLGDVLTIVIVAGGCYEIYVRAVMREEARQRAKEQAGASGASA